LRVIVAAPIFPDECFSSLKPLSRSHMRLDINDPVRFGLLCDWSPPPCIHCIEFLGNYFSGHLAKTYRDCVSYLCVLLACCPTKLPIRRELLYQGVFLQCERPHLLGMTKGGSCMIWHCH